MIRKQTVLILGAGSSAPYGYPLGAGLVDRILTLITPPSGDLYPILIQDPRHRIRDFHDHLLKSQTSSIDDFLESNPDYAPLGKQCIAAALTVWGPTQNHVVAEGDHWYRYLWERLRQGAPTSEHFKQNNLQIITYNYDRSFERYFAAVLQHTYPNLAKAGVEAAEQLRAQVLPAIHLHGSLGGAGDRAFEVPDRPTQNRLDFYEQAAAGIRILHEDKPTNEYATAQAWLHEAEAICFLGFGFHPTNIRRLAVVDQIRGRSGVFVGGTALGLEEAEVVRAESLLGVGGPRFLRSENALMYLRRYAPLE